MSEALKHGYLISKNGMYYRPDSAGYTSAKSEAGRYSLCGAISITHPNGLDGPRDGMRYMHESEVKDRRADLPATDEQAFANEKVKALVEALAFLASEEECRCMWHSRGREIAYETETCPHQKARATLKAIALPSIAAMESDNE